MAPSSLPTNNSGPELKSILKSRSEKYVQKNMGKSKTYSNALDLPLLCAEKISEL